MGGGFDFDELEIAEAAVQETTEPGQGEAPSTDVQVADVVFQQSVQGPDGELALHRGRGRGRPSKARTWFEIRRFFEAEPQKYYRSPDKDEWKTYYAKELILKTLQERLQQDGFVVIDAKLAPAFFKELLGHLALEAPERAAELEDLAGGPRPQEVGWVGCYPKPQPQALVNLPEDSITETPQDRVLYESCQLSLGTGKSSCAMQPKSKSQFLRFMKAYVHTIAANSMSPIPVKPEDKISVQLSFGLSLEPITTSGPPRVSPVEWS